MLEWLIPLAVVLSTTFTVILLLLPTQYQPRPGNVRRGKPESTSTQQHDVSVQVLVLGDIGRSPRMQYHALSVAKHGGSVQLIGYLDTEPLPELKNHPNVSIVPLPASPKALQTNNKALFLILAPVKVLLQVWTVWYVLGYQTQASKWLLVQNPPSIPTLLVATIVCFLRQTRLVIDWHNFGYSILGLKLGSDHPLVQISRWYEKVLARTAYSHFAVTDAMKSVLEDGFVGSTPVLTLHDRPAAIFQPLLPQAQMTFLSQHSTTTDHFSNMVDHRTRLIVSSTSWTADEDFSVLLKALCQYSASATSTSPQLPELLVVITGKGPQKDHYIRKIQEMQKTDELEMVTIKTAWLSFEDYASLLGVADLGVSLHTSSSGVDLPMKVVDMFGAGLPVLGYSKFKAWPELVKEKVNGRGFVSAEQMGDIMEELFEPGNPQLETLKRGALEESKRRWDEEWDPIAGRLFELTF